jgi:hypothetical protein
MDNSDQQPSTREARAQGVRGQEVGALQTSGYSPADAAHMVEQYLEGPLNLDGLEDWLDHYPYSPTGPQPNDVEDEINRAVLAVRGYRSGSRDLNALHQELRDVRSHLTGYAYSAGQPARQNAG